MKYLIYLRVSSDKQDVETQNRICLEHIKRLENNKDYEYEIFSDLDTSSRVKMSKRLGLQQMLNSMKKGQTVLVYKLDRLSRDVIEMITIYRMIKDTSVNIIAINDPYSDEFSITIMGAIAQKERENIQKRTRDALQTKKSRGERYNFQVPFGFKIHETKQIAIRVGDKYILKHGVIIESQEEQKALVLMQELFAMGNSYQEIANILDDQGYKNRANKAFQKMSIFRILKRIKHSKLVDQLQYEKESVLSPV